MVCNEIPDVPLRDKRNPKAFFAEEREGWHGYIEWERYPEKQKKAAEILAQYNFAGEPEFQLTPLPDTNPRLEGVRWKQYHAVLGPTLDKLPKQSWDIVKEEKAEDMIHVLDFPYNGEPPRDRLVETPFTRNEDHFVRNHGGIPIINEDQYFLEIGGMVNEPKKLTMKDLKDEKLFPRQTAVVTIQCSGTRRIEQINEYPGDGDELINAPWGEGAIGTARWTGVSLKKVLKHCGGLKEGAKHIEFMGVDTYFKKGKVYNYVVSVPWRKVRIHEVMLAWEMNGKPLPKIHGYPLRAVVFGYIGARSVKWLARINAISEPSEAPVQKKEYLYYTPQAGKHNATYSSGFSIQDMPVASAIISPIDKAVIVHDGTIKMRGWAYSGGGHWPERVEVSGDGGSVWYETPYEGLSQKYYHAWRLWSVDLPVDAEGWLELVVRCWDNALNTQPTFVRSAWNWDLHVTSSCHRVKVFSVNRSHPATAKRLQLLDKKGVDLLPLTKPLEIDLEEDEEYETEMQRRGGRDPEE
uniref:Putative molybdopterin binding oxidoreductase n=1 Tax=Cladonia uncialis subsp. uncialis TaxID=180999 RepID=A0A1Z1C521_CLAUC|nr:putative oxidoreductase [Cladonia uncialis subsp. uncialis]AUW30900.1 putative molybdopterin binding oxidoreductase [Cladonia uncialis subsp. uncialis]